ncbi:MAG TPA: hypothetical protein VI685_11905 [Candidatus Angelobacter sp.]
MADTRKVSQKSTAPTPVTPPPPAAPPPITTNRAAIASRAQQMLNLVHGRLSNVEARVIDKANALLAQVQSKQVQALTQNSADVKEQLPVLLDSLQKVPTATQASQTARSQGISTLLTKLRPVGQAKT